MSDEVSIYRKLPDVTRKPQSDVLVGILVTGISLAGIYVWWRARLRVQRADSMMQDMMGHGIAPYTLDPNVYLLLTSIGVGVVVAIYFLARSRSAETSPLKGPEHASREDGSTELVPSALELLPEDENRILKPVLQSPGLTQVELRGRSDFSKSKVSQVVTTLEKRGLLYREPQGRTYRIYPGELTKQHVDPGTEAVPAEEEIIANT